MTAEEKKQYAAICYALGWTRSMLSDVLEEEGDVNRIRQVLEASATPRIAQSIGMTEADLALDWNEHLTDLEKWAISGRSDA